MLSPDVTVEDFTAEDWVALGRIWRGERPRASAGLVALTDGGVLVKLLSTSRGRIDLAAQPWPLNPAELCEAHGARFVLLARRGALEEAMERWALRLDPEHSFTAQMLELLAVFRDLESEGALQLFPRPFGSIKVVSERVIDAFFDAVCPAGKSFLFGAFEGGEVATCVAMHRSESGFDRIVGPEQLRREMGLISGDWTRDYRHLARAAELTVGTLSLGCFAEMDTWQRLFAARTPGAWSAAVAVRDVVLHPVVPAIAIPLGIDVGRVAIAAVRDLAGRVGASWLFREDSPFSPALRRVRQMASTEELSNVLGFDPVNAVLGFLDDIVPHRTPERDEPEAEEVAAPDWQGPEPEDAAASDEEEPEPEYASPSDQEST